MIVFHQPLSDRHRVSDLQDEGVAAADRFVDRTKISPLRKSRGGLSGDVYVELLGHLLGKLGSERRRTASDSCELIVPVVVHLSPAPIRIGSVTQLIVWNDAPRYGSPLNKSSESLLRCPRPSCCLPAAPGVPSGMAAARPRRGLAAAATGFSARPQPSMLRCGHRTTAAAQGGTSSPHHRSRSRVRPVADGDGGANEHGSTQVAPVRATAGCADWTRRRHS